MNNIYNEMGLTDPRLVRMLEQIISEIIDKKIKQLQNPFIPATVQSAAGGLVTVLINDGSSTPITNIKDKTKEGLSPSDEVYLLRINGSSNNMVALIKK